MKKVRDLMSTGIVSVYPDTRLSEITRIMVEKGIHGVYVFDPEKRITGTIDDTDIIKIFGKKLVENVKAKEVMSKVDIKVRPETTIKEAVDIMREKRKRKLYVFYNKEDIFPVGVLSIKDIIGEVDREKLAIEFSRFLAQYQEFQEWLELESWKKMARVTSVPPAAAAHG